MRQYCTMPTSLCAIVAVLMCVLVAGVAEPAPPVAPTQLLRSIVNVESLLFRGRVFSGAFGDTSRGLPGVTVLLYASNDAGSRGELLAQAVTNASGRFELRTAMWYEYFTVVEQNLQGYTSTGATAPGARSIDGDLILYAVPFQPDHLLQIRFWDMPRQREPDLPGGPDLAIGAPITWETDFDRFTLTVRVPVENVGDLPAPETTLTAADRDRSWAGSYVVPALGPGQSADVPFKVKLPAELTGFTYRFNVRVDPQGHVRGDPNRENNYAVTPNIGIPPDERVPRPKIASVQPSSGLRGTEMTLVIVGRDFIEGVDVSLGEGIRIISTTRVSDRRLRVRIRIGREADASPRDVEVRNPPDRGGRLPGGFTVLPTGVAPEPLRPDSSLPEGILVALAVIGGTALTISRTVRVRRRKRWQREAKEEEPHEECTPCTRYCRRFKPEVELKPVEVDCVAVVSSNSAGKELARTRIAGDIAGGLNAALAESRRGGALEELADAMASLSKVLLQRISKWLPARHARATVSLTGHLKGGKITCKFILYHCERRGASNVWVEEREWEAEVEDERDERIGSLHGLDPSDSGRVAKAESELAELLVKFVSGV